MSNKLTLNKMKSIAVPKKKPTIITYYTEENEEINIEFDTNLSLIDMSNFVDTVVKELFMEDGEYIPEYRDVMTFIALIGISNIPIPKKKTKEGIDYVDVKTAYEWMQKLSIMEMLKCQDERLGELVWLYNKLNQIIDEKIEFKKQEVFATLKADLQRTYNEIEKFTNVMYEFQDKIKDVDLAEMSNVAKSLASKDEREIVNTIVEIRSKQDEFLDDKNKVIKFDQKKES